MRFHLDRQTGGVSRAIERGARASSRCCALRCSTSCPPLLELVMVTAIVWRMFDWRFAVVTCRRWCCYIAFTSSFASLARPLPPHA